MSYHCPICRSQPLSGPYDSQGYNCPTCLTLHMRVLCHAANCKDPRCPSANCTKMKGLIKHEAVCKVKAKGGCFVCKRMSWFLRTYAEQKKTKQLLKNLMGHQHGWVFNSPVDPVELGLPDYTQIVKRPMDLGTVKKRLESGVYSSLSIFYSDVLLTFNNALLYNSIGTQVHEMAKEMKKYFIVLYDEMAKEMAVENDVIKRRNGTVCTLCGFNNCSTSLCTDIWTSIEEEKERLKLERQTARLHLDPFSFPFGINFEDDALNAK